MRLVRYFCNRARSEAFALGKEGMAMWAVDRLKEWWASRKVDCSKLPKPVPEEGETKTHKIALARCNCLIDQYLLWKKQNLWKSNLAQRAVLILTAITPVLLLITWNNVNERLFGAAFSAMAAIATGLLAISGWRENYIRYGHVWHALQCERYRYLTHATEEYRDSNKERAARNFASRIEQLVMTEVTEWQALMERVEQQNRNVRPAGDQGDSEGPSL
jgi:hypothetical protein